MITKRRIILLCVMAAIIAVAPFAAAFADRGDGGQSGAKTQLITLWQIDSFEGGKGSRAAYLQRVADERAKTSGAYIKVVTISSAAARANIAAGNIPDIISYGAGFYGIESLVNARDFLYKCWCYGGYFLLSLGTDGAFADVTARNTVLNAGRDNLAAACAMFEGLSGCAVESCESAYVSLLSGKYKYLLGTQRDIFRLKTRGVQYCAKPITSFNDLYQNISIICDDEKYPECLGFVEQLINSDGIDALGLAHGGEGADELSEVAAVDFEYEIRGFAGKEYIDSLLQAVRNEDLNSLKNLLK